MNAIGHINQHPDLTATERGDRVEITVYGRPVGHITGQDIEDAESATTPTGWPASHMLRKGALKVYRAIRGE